MTQWTLCLFVWCSCGIKALLDHHLGSFLFLWNWKKSQLVLSCWDEGYCQWWSFWTFSHTLHCLMQSHSSAAASGSLSKNFVFVCWWNTNVNKSDPSLDQTEFQKVGEPCDTTKDCGVFSSLVFPTWNKDRFIITSIAGVYLEKMTLTLHVNNIDNAIWCHEPP